MQQQGYYLQSILLFSVALLLTSCNICRALECKLNNGNVASTITVSRSSEGKFKKIQDAIDSVPVNNDQWIRILVSSGVYVEKVTVPQNKPCIFLQGSGEGTTKIQWKDHQSMTDSATFNALADNFIAKDITFKNNYNAAFESLIKSGSKLTQALAAKITGDKAAFYNCHFIGVQDTLFDALGRHYFHGCQIEGVIDFIFGNGQSIYENCVVKVAMKENFSKKGHGYITAQGRERADEPTGFVFRGCKFVGSGKAYLGRAYRAFSRVIIANSELSGIIEPKGWNAWNYASQIQNTEYVEVNCTGAGADTSKRVPWEKKFPTQKLTPFINGYSFIDKEGWMAKLPPHL